MANPFLMDDDLPQSTETYSNPFLMDDLDVENETIDYVSDNPFVAGSNNPFAAFGGDDAASNEIQANVPMTTASNFFASAAETNPITTNSDFFSNNAVENVQSTHFFDTTIVEDEPIHSKPSDLNIKNHSVMNDFDDNSAYSSEDELKFKKKPPPRPNVPPSKATQDLILSVANELDLTSSHLLDRIPKTRTPSPVSIRDLHSPSPTPDMNVDDLLDVSDSMQATTQQSENNFFDTNNEFVPVQPSQVINSSPFGNIIQPQPIQTRPPPPNVQPIVKDDVNKSQPPRPRPPPPRPAPPSKTSPVTQFPPPIPQQPHRPPPPASTSVQPIQQEPDLFDMFGTGEAIRPPPKPPAPKTNEDILSLYSVPVNQNNNTETNKMPDLLSGDILDDVVPPLDNSTKNKSSEILAKEKVLVSNNVEPDITQETVRPLEFVQTESEIIEIIQPPTKLTPPDELNVKPIVEEILEPGNKLDENELNNIPDLIPSGAVSPNPNIFNMVITCEPDNPPSDEEDPIDYTPTPSKQQPVDINDEELFNKSLESQTPANEEEKTENESDDQPVEQTEVVQESVVNPFGSPHEEEPIEPIPEPVPIYQPPPTPAAGFDYQETPSVPMNIFSSVQSTPQSAPPVDDAFDAFAAKFDSVDNNKKQTNIFLEEVDQVSNSFSNTSATADAWGDSSSGFNDPAGAVGFGGDDGFDSFLAMEAPPAVDTGFNRNDSRDSDEAKEFNVVIRPKDDIGLGSITPVLAPPPKTSQNNSIYSGDSSPRFNPFDKGYEDGTSADGIPIDKKPQVERTDSQESPQTPLFDDDVSQPLEDFPRVNYEGDGWEMQLRQPNKKRITAQRFWKKILLKLTLQGDNPVLQLFIGPNDKEPFQELPLQACYSVSDISAQQYDQFGKIFTVKLQYIFYKERPGVRPGQVTKAERLTSKLSQFAAYAIQGDYQGVKEFGSDLKKLGIPVEHAPQVSELFKLGSLNFEDMKQFSVCIEEALFKLDVHRDRALNYKTEEVQITAVDELYVEQDAEGHVLKQIARVRLFFLGFLSGMPYVELGVNDLWRQGKEVVGRHDIIPVVTEEWIRLEGVEFHTCVQQNEYEKTRTIRFQPPDACYIELMRFRVRPPKNRELPLQLKATWCVIGNKVELRADILVPGFASRKLGQIPCEDVMIRFPIPECWIYLFRVEKHFRYGSVKSAHRRTGKVKGIERILGAVEQLQESLIEVTSGSAKYEHQHRALVWRCPRLPKEGQGAYTTHQLVCRLALTSYDQIPEQLAPYCYVEFTMPATQVSHTTVRSVSIQDSDSDEPPEKYVRYLARHEYRVGIEHTNSESTNPYLAATVVTNKPIREESPKPEALAAVPSDSDSDSN